MDERKTNEICSPEMMQALSVFGKMLSIASIYGMSHPSLARPLLEAHHTLSEALEQDGMVMLGLFNKKLTINDKMLTDYTVHLRALERRFIAIDMPHLVFRKGILEEELRQLVEALCASGGGAVETPIKERIDAANLDHIKADQVQYVAQHEGQRLVGEDEGSGEGDEGLGGGSDKNGEDGAGAGGKAKEEEKEEPEEAEPVIKVEQIVAFLKGAPGATEAPGDDLQELVADPEKLGELILESAEVRQTAQSLDSGESLADIVIGCLRKTYDGLAQQKKYKSTRGKASLNKAMLLLEQTVVDKIRNAVGEEQPELDEQILEALREAEEQRQVEILAARFVEQQKKITKVELDILRYVREYGEEKARQMLSSSEIPDEKWNRMMIENRASGGGSSKGEGEGKGPGGSGAGPGGAGGGDNIDMGALAIVLDKLEDIMELDNVPPEIIGSALGEVRETAEETAVQATKQVESLEEQVHLHEEDAGKPPEERKSKKSRAELLEEIANLALTLAQPLTVITVSIESALQKSTPPDIRKDLLEMAHESAERMKELMKRLTQLVGYPSMKVADAGIDE